MCACGKSSLVLSVSGFFLILDTTHPVPLNNKKVEEEFALTVLYSNCNSDGQWHKLFDRWLLF